jgi:hypothetical protein
VLLQRAYSRLRHREHIASEAGGGILCGGTMCIRGSIISGNRAEKDGTTRGVGGGVYCGSDGSRGITNCVLAGNWASSWDSHEIYREGQPDLAVWTLVGSSIPSQGETTSWVDPTAGLFPSRFYRISSP